MVSRDNNFDFIRCVLAVLVIFSHSFPLALGHEDTEPLHALSGGQLTLGGLAVDAFFIISGFLITESWLRGKSGKDFFRKRVLRIYPAFAVATALGLFVVVPWVATRPVSAGVGDWLLATLRLRQVTPPGLFADNPYPGPLNGSLWSISYEFWCYIGIALLGACAALRRPTLMVGLWLATIVASIVFITFQLNLGTRLFGAIFGFPPFWARLLPYYLAGAVFLLWRDRIPMTGGLAAVALAALAAGVLVAPWGVALTFPAALTYLVLYLAQVPAPRLARWAKHGDFSYGIYLYAFPIQQLLMWRFPSLTPLQLFVLAVPPTVACAVASWHLIEKPFMRLGATRRPRVLEAGASADVAAAPRVAAWASRPVTR